MGKNFSPEIKFVEFMTQSAAYCGLIFGSARGSRLAIEDRQTKHLIARYQHKVTRQVPWFKRSSIKAFCKGKGTEAFSMLITNVLGWGFFFHLDDF